MAAIMGLHTRKIIGWPMRDHLRAELATSALLMAPGGSGQKPGCFTIRTEASSMPAATARQPWPAPASPHR